MRVRGGAALPSQSREQHHTHTYTHRRAHTHAPTPTMARSEQAQGSVADMTPKCSEGGSSGRCMFRALCRICGLKWRRPPAPGPLCILHVVLRAQGAGRRTRIPHSRRKKPRVRVPYHRAVGSVPSRCVDRLPPPPSSSSPFPVPFHSALPCACGWLARAPSPLHPLPLLGNAIGRWGSEGRAAAAGLPCIASFEN